MLHCRRRRRRPRGETSSLSFATALKTVAILLLADADDEVEEIAALAVAQLAFSAWQDQLLEAMRDWLKMDFLVYFV